MNLSLFFLYILFSWSDISWGKCLTWWASAISGLCEDCLCPCTWLLLEEAVPHSTVGNFKNGCAIHSVVDDQVSLGMVPC